MYLIFTDATYKYWCRSLSLIWSWDSILDSMYMCMCLYVYVYVFWYRYILFSLMPHISTDAAAFRSSDVEVITEIVCTCVCVYVYVYVYRYRFILFWLIYKVLMLQPFAHLKKRFQLRYHVYVYACMYVCTSRDVKLRDTWRCHV